MPIAPPCHTRTAETTDDWITPKWLIERIGPFDLDPCASEFQPWPCAAQSIHPPHDGLMASWRDQMGQGQTANKCFVFCNPPYGRATEAWLNRMALHDHGIALVFARTETRAFFKYVWPHASALLFLRGRLSFFYPDGSESKHGKNSGGPSVLVAYGDLAKTRLHACRDLGAFVELRTGSISSAKKGGDRRG